MGFWDEVKEFGQSVGESLKKAGEKSIEDFKKDPTGFCVRAASKAGSLIIEAIPVAAFNRMKENERLFRKGDLNKDQAKQHAENKERMFNMEIRSANKLIETEPDCEDSLRGHIRHLDASRERLRWFSSHIEGAEDVRELISQLGAAISESHSALRNLERRNAVSAENNAEQFMKIIINKQFFSKNMACHIGGRPEIDRWLIKLEEEVKETLPDVTVKIDIADGLESLEYIKSYRSNKFDYGSGFGIDIISTSTTNITDPEILPRKWNERWNNLPSIKSLIGYFESPPVARLKNPAA